MPALALLLALPLASAVRLQEEPEKHLGNFARTGQSPGEAPVDLTQPAWVFEKKGEVFYQSPVMDKDRNAYFSSTSGNVYSVAPGGSINWYLNIRRDRTRLAGQIPKLVVYDGSLYSIDGQGWLVVIDVATGKIRWRGQHGAGSGADSWSIGFDEASKTLFAITFPVADDAWRCMYGGTQLVALNISNGIRKWSYDLKECNCNVQPTFADGRVIFTDLTGGVYALDARTGRELWKVVGRGGSFTTGSAAVSEGLVFAAANTVPGHGVLHVYDAATGQKKWERHFDREANGVPAVYRDKRGKLRVVLGVGNNGELPNPEKEGKIGFLGTVYALDAERGLTLWEFSPPLWTNPAPAGSSKENLCMANAFSNPAVDGKGTVYVGWMGGELYGLDGSTGEMIASWSSRSGMQGAPGIADGVLVVASCQRMAGFVRQ